MLWQLRPAKDSDLPFIFSSWLKSFRDARMVTGVSNTVYYSRFHKLIENTLLKPETVILIACSKEEEEQIFGYAVGAPRTLYWAYVKHPFRGFGLGKALVTEFNPLIHTTLGKPSSLLASSSYDPFILWQNIKE